MPNSVPAKSNAPARPPGMREYFRHGGLLSRWHPQFEFRPGQLEMALEVEAALAESRHLIVEAGTGTGKTLAYLIPALASGKRVVVSTGTKALQEQLYYKDIPFLEKHARRKLKAAYMKGRANYLCRQKVYEAEKRPVLDGLVEIEDFAIIRKWEATTKTGDRAELKSLPADSTVWPKFDARRELCAGTKCEQFERCFITLMHQRAAEADLIIVNHHLFFADLALRQGDYAAVIPGYQAVVFDEAHEVEEVAGEHFGLQISNYRFDELLRDVIDAALRLEITSKDLHRATETVRQAAQDFFALFQAAEGRRGFRERAHFLERHEKPYRRLTNALAMLHSALSTLEKRGDEMIPLERRTREITAALQFLIEEEEDRRFVFWVERRGRGVFLQATPIDVAGILAARLFGETDTVILTSATLAVDNSFDYIRGRLGVGPARELIVPGHFDYRSQVLFYVPEELPDPRSELFAKRAADEVIRILRCSEGRAFVLFTSYQQMRLVHDIVSFAIEYPTLLQGTAPNSALLDEFRSTPNCVLFATASFWQGVDVPGDQLSCVIIDKLPFAPPSDPVVEARIRNLREEGGNPFYEYQVPEAVLQLKQGFGRLIRNTKDRGVLALLDSRILRQRYGQVFLSSLPDYAFSTSIADVESFFAGAG